MIEAGLKETNESFWTDTVSIKKVKETELTRRKEKGIKEGSMVTADYLPMLDVLDRQMQVMYTEPWGKPIHDLTKLVKPRTTRDFRTVKTFQADELDNLAEVLEKEDYKETKIVDRLLVEYALKKWGKIFTTSWESYINDDMDEIRQVPEKLMRAARRRRMIQINALYAANVAFFNIANANIGAGALNEARLETGITAVASQTDVNGNPISIIPVYLVVPTALMHTGRRLVNDVASLRGIVGALTRNTQPIDYTLELIVDPYLDAISVTGWYLFCDPKEITTLEWLSLRGHENPELFLRRMDALRLSEFGSASEPDPYDGTFSNDDLEWKGRDIHNATTVDHRGGYYSTGTTP